MVPWVSQDTDKLAAQAAHTSPASRGPAAAIHLTNEGPEPSTKPSGPSPLPAPSAARFATPHDPSSVSTPGKDEEGSGSIKHANPNGDIHAPFTPPSLRGQPSRGQASSLHAPAWTRQHRHAVMTGTAPHCPYTAR
jgi:hypothetical protein